MNLIVTYSKLQSWTNSPACELLLDLPGHLLNQQFPPERQHLLSCALKWQVFMPVADN